MSFDWVEFFRFNFYFVGALYLLTSLAVVVGGKWLRGIQQRFVDLPEEQLRLVNWAYVALFKVLFIVFVVGPFVATLMMD